MQDSYSIPFLFDIPSTAKILSISRTAVYKLIRDGELQTVRVGRARRISRKQLDDYISRLELAG
jgi:excisionase family DNA binding protein